jgi:N-acetyl sugar amidotransferase
MTDNQSTSIQDLEVDPQQMKLPTEVKFCTRCVMSNQRPRIVFDEECVCSACRYSDIKNIGRDWPLLQQQFMDLCDRHRSNDGSYDVIVPCSGGKDSSAIAHRLKTEYKMNPLCVTFSPPVYSEIGWKNLRSFIDAGFDHSLISPRGTIHRGLTKAGFVHLGDHNEIFDHGQMSAPFAEAVRHGVKLVIYGENGEAEYGGTTDNNDKPGMPWEDFKRCYYSTGLDDLIETALDKNYISEKTQPNSFDIYRLPNIDKMQELGVEMHWFAYYHLWTPQENYYHAAKYTGFKANPEGRTEGTYSKYAQLDDLTDPFLYYMMFVKYGFGRATSDAAHEVRDGHIERDEAIALVKRYDDEFPARYFEVFLEYVDLTKDEFWEVVDRFRLPHIWKKEGNNWKLRFQVS